LYFLLFYNSNVMPYLSKTSNYFGVAAEILT